MEPVPLSLLLLGMVLAAVAMAETVAPEAGPALVVDGGVLPRLKFLGGDRGNKAMFLLTPLVGDIGVATAATVGTAAATALAGVPAGTLSWPLLMVLCTDFFLILPTDAFFAMVADVVITVLAS